MDLRLITLVRDLLLDRHFDFRQDVGDLATRRPITETKGLPVPAVLDLRLYGLHDFSGVVRRYDISAANTVQSEQVANATVIYAGQGPLTNTTNRRGIGSMFHSAISWLWPF